MEKPARREVSVKGQVPLTKKSFCRVALVVGLPGSRGLKRGVTDTRLPIAVQCFQTLREEILLETEMVYMESHLRVGISGEIGEVNLGWTH